MQVLKQVKRLQEDNMAQYIPRQRSTAERFSDAFVAGSEAGLDAYKTSKENEAIEKMTGKDLSGLPPELRNHYAQQLFNRNLDLDAARASIPSDLAGNSPAKSGVNPKELAGNSTAKVGANPKELATPPVKEQPPQGQKTQPILNTKQMREAAADIVNDGWARGKSIDFTDALQQVRNQNSDAISERDLQKVAMSEGLNEYKKSFGENYNLTPEHENYISNKMQNARNSGMSEAEIKKLANQEGKNIANAFANLERKVPQNRTTTKLKNLLTGGGLEQGKEEQSIRNMVKPLLDAGLHDEVRELLGNGPKGKGYGAEEIEELISSLSESANKKLQNLGQMPNAIENVLKNRKKPNEKNSRLSSVKGAIDQLMSNARVPEEDRGRVTETLEEILKANPTENLILLRKQMAEQGVDWRTFKGTLDDLITAGKISLPEEQNKFMGVLDEPPLSYLNDILYGLGLTGK